MENPEPESFLVVDINVQAVIGLMEGEGYMVKIFLDSDWTQIEIELYILLFLYQ